jgi:copper chaperone NosL
MVALIMKFFNWISSVGAADFGRKNCVFISPDKLVFLLLAIIFISCEIKPEPLNYGTDACHTCKMTLMDNKFGAEIVTKKGKVYKFDDLNCMINFYNSGNEPEDNIAYKLVIDFANPGEFIDASQNYYVKSDSIRTPMASGVAAFSNEKDFKSYKKKWKGILLSWSELTTEFK